MLCRKRHGKLPGTALLHVYFEDRIGTASTEVSTDEDSLGPAELVSGSRDATCSFAKLFKESPSRPGLPIIEGHIIAPVADPSEAASGFIAIHRCELDSSLRVAQLQCFRWAATIVQVECRRDQGMVTFR